MKYDGILICTDMDGTFLPTEENIKALRYFQDNGGRFSVATGRYVDYIKNYFMEKTYGFKPNAPISLNNGSLIYDLTKDEIVKESFMPKESLEEILQIKKERDFILSIYQDGGGVVNESADEINKDVILERMYKICCGDRENIAELEALLRERFETKYEISKSCSSFIELNPKGINKGYATNYIKEITKSKTLICVGDYGNDIPMLKSADISYAVSNATDEVKKAAMRITVSNTEHAMAKIIEDLDRI